MGIRHLEPQRAVIESGGGDKKLLKKNENKRGQHSSGTGSRKEMLAASDACTSNCSRRKRSDGSQRYLLESRRVETL